MVDCLTRVASESFHLFASSETIDRIGSVGCVRPGLVRDHVLSLDFVRSCWFEKVRLGCLSQQRCQPSDTASTSVFRPS